MGFLLWMFGLLFITVGGSDVDFVDAEGAVKDTEGALKCDACKGVAFKFGEYFKEAHGDLLMTSSLKDEDIIDAAESTCDDTWEGYSVSEVDGTSRLGGPGTGIKLEGEPEDDPVWPRRLQDMCDELLGDIPDEKTLYKIWLSGDSLEDYLCKGDGIFGACSSDDWGPWPGEDYDDYEDGDDYDFIHDEF